MDLSESNTIDHHKDDKKCECNKCSVKCVSSLNILKMFAILNI